MKSTHDRILNVLNEVTGYEELEYLDSLDTIDVIAALENEFDVEIEGEELPVTMKGVVELVESLI